MNYPKDQCFINVPQHFLVGVTVHKAKDLQTLNADTYVTVTLDKKTKQTATFKKSDCPFFNEYFVFENYCTLTELLRLNVSLVLFHKRSCTRKDVRLGEIVVDLNMLWNLPNHSFHKKWAVLENDSPPEASAIQSYLQFDLAIISKDEHPKPTVLQVRDYDNIESNLLQPLTTTDVYHKVKYIMNIYEGDFIRSGSYSVQISFAANVLRTKYVKTSKTPEFNEKFCFPGNFPSLCQTITIQVLINDILSSSCYAMAEIHLDEICDDGYGLVNYPTIGPTHFQFYDLANKNQYLGQLLLAIETDPVDIDMPKKPKVDPIPSLLEVEYWSTETFQVRVVVFSVSRIITSSSKLKIQFHLGAYSSNTVDYPLCEYSKGAKTFFTVTPTTYQLMSGNIQMPDNRLKYQIQFSLNCILDDTKSQINRFKLWVLSNPQAISAQLQFANKIVHDLTETLMNFCGNLYFKIFKRLTQWDKNRLAFLQAFVEENIASLEKLKKHLNRVTTNSSKYLYDFENVVFKLIMNISSILANALQDKWPDLIIEMHGHNESFYYRADSRMYCYSQNKSSMGRFCGKRHDVLLKPTECSHTCTYCGCYAGSANLSAWIGTIQDKDNALPDDCVVAENGQVSVATNALFKCNLYVHQAKIRPGSDRSGLADVRIAATLNDTQGFTAMIQNTLSPLWNEVITFNCIKVAGSPASYVADPTIIFLDIYDFDGRKKNSKELLSTAILRPMTKILNTTGTVFTTSPESVNENHSEVVESNRDSEPPGTTMNPTRTMKKINEKIEQKRRKNNLPDFGATVFPTPLQWIDAVKDGEVCAEILCSAELIQLPGKVSPTESVTNKIGIPSEICPNMANYKVEVTFAGLRQCKHLPSRTMGRYKIEMSFAELNLKSGPSSNKYGDSVNFLDPFRAGYVSLPEQTKYWPPIIIKHLDCSSKKEISIGAAMFANTEKFLVNEIHHSPAIESNNVESFPHNETELDPLLVKNSNKKFPQFFNIRMKKTDQHKISVSKMKQQDAEKKFTWWTKFYNSLNHGQSCGIEKHRLTIFDSELEEISEFSNLTDWAEPMFLRRGTNSKKSSGPKDITYGMLKCNIRVTKTSDRESIIDMSNDRIKEVTNLITETKIIVRIYIVQGLNLRSKDVNGNSDSYLRIEFGTEKIIDRAHYIPNQSNPIFGKRFQVNGILPKDTELKISVYDYDKGQLLDDLIGSTVIDVEDRLRSKHRAYCGLAQEYSSYGYNFWRDPHRPSQILKQICHKYDLGEPNYVGNKIKLAGITFGDTTTLPSTESIQERLCLSVLKNLERIPQIGFKLIPEHVETRSLYHKDRPGLEQGKLQLWIEIFESDNVPEPIDLTPSPPRAYELRVIVWNTTDVILDEKNIFGKYMSDIYVKGWLIDVEDAQNTDTHYRSLTGDGNFNWRMIFPLLYSESEDVMVVRKKKSVYDKFDTESKLPTNLQIQIWDDDAISADDFLGSLAINISNIPSPAKKPSTCKLNQSSKFINLFEVERVRGWFPAKGIMKNGKMGLTGKVELEMEVLLADVAAADPVGKGREDPHALPPPNRPDSSFNWLNPFSLMKYVVGRVKKYLCWCFYVMIAIVILVMLFYILPSGTFRIGSWTRKQQYSEWSD